MKLVIDTNRFIAALIKDGETRRIIFSNKFMFVTPAFAIEEIDKYREMLISKMGVNAEELNLVIDTLTSGIEIIDDEILKSFREEGIRIMQNVDERDSAFIACALATNADGIFSEDKHFEKQNRVRLYKNKDLVNIIVRK